MAVRRPGWFLCREVTEASLRVVDARKAHPWQPRVLLQEASELSSLKPQLEELGVPLVAVVKENIGTEIQDFRPHFAGDIYVDDKVSLLQSHPSGFGWLSRPFVETLLRPAAEKDGGSGLFSSGSVAELHTGLEVRLPGQHERRGLPPGGGVCHRSRRAGSATR